MKAALAAFGAGILFGLGLAVSHMTDPAKVLAFLDVAGNWDPSLILVMAGALAVYVVAARVAATRAAPLFTDGFQLPTRTDIDAPLVVGALLFGGGWGLAGLCPGPAITALVSGQANAYLFVAAMLAGMLIHRVTMRERGRPRP